VEQSPKEMKDASVSCSGVSDKVRNLDYQKRVSSDGLPGADDWGRGSEIGGSSAMA
jgi:hypothetical protein